MPSLKPTRVPDAAEVATLAPEQVAGLLRSMESLKHQNDELKRQLEWFKRQLFGRKSERFVPEPDPQQMHLESPRVLRRLQPLRRWSHEQVEQVLT